MKDDVFGIIISAIIMILLFCIGLVLLSGRGSFLISGYNILPKSEKEKYDTKALCRFTGSLLLVIDCFLPIAIIAGIYEITWLIKLIVFLIISIALGCIIYASTNNRFKKK